MQQISPRRRRAAMVSYFEQVCFRMFLYRPQTAAAAHRTVKALGVLD